MSQHSELLNLALEKSKLAVNRDSGVGDKASLNMYREAVEALQKVLDTDTTGNKSKLKSIQESYLKRIEFLSSTLTKLNVVTPIHKQPALLELKPSTSTPITARKKSNNHKINNNNRYSTDFSKHEKIRVKQDYFKPDSPDTMFFEKQFKIDLRPKSVVLDEKTMIDSFHPHMEPSVSTSSFQTILGRKKNSKLAEENNLKSTLVSYLQYNKKTPSNNVDLGRSKSKKKWSINASTNNNHQHNSKMPYMSSQCSLHSVTEDTTTSITLMDTFLESMTQGGFITSNLYVPKDLWFQSNVKLPAIDAKIVACELLFVIFERMEKRKDFHDFHAIEIDLNVLEQTLNQIKDTLIKKLGCLNPGNELAENSPSRYSFMGGSSGIKTTQTLSAWSSKLSKSVERMKFEASKAIPSNDQNNEAYIKILIRLFTLAKVLEQWSVIIETIAHQKPLTYKRAFLTIQRCINLFKATICEFVLKDYETLLDKWLKRSSDWMFD